MIDRIKNDKGFTLIEIIFSVAFLCIVSVIVLKLFVASYEIENKTDLVDMATLHMVNEIESIKGLESLNEDHVTVEKYYDKMWKQLSYKTDAYYLVSVIADRNSKYDRGLYDIEASVMDLVTNENVVHVETMHYYNSKE
ncbi:MAG: type II secretion system protein [Clostridiales bacterium]|nr:type II secretion system protein [Clostridiales bacterium]